MKLHSWCQPEATREAKLIPAVHPRLEDIVQPLLAFLNTKGRDPEHGPYAVVAPSPLCLLSGHPGLHVELHANTKQLAVHATLTDVRCQQIINEEIVRPFRAGDADAGTTAGVRAILAALRPATAR